MNLAWLLAEQADANSGWDILARLVDNASGIIAAIAAGIALIAVRRAGKHQDETTEKIDRLGQDTTAIRDSTVNDHARPMRYDLDDGFRDLAAAIVAVRGDVSELSASASARFDKIEGQIDHVDARSARIGDEVRDEQHARITLGKTVAAAIERAETVIRKHHPD